MPIIQVDHLTKEYRLGAMQGLKQTLLNGAARLTGKKVEAPPLFKALDDVNFSIEPGEVVGIIGHNGAGKSTLLKMLARISTPTHGSVTVNGRIAPLIEVGAGFVPDFTGRENVYLNAAILGMSKQDIEKKFDEIVDFAEMAEFIDTPVKRYSSGMQVKLAFAVATSIESEILIVDEVLAVGDLAFQRKCFNRMESLIKHQGRTVIIVGHHIRQLEQICTRMVMLSKGKITIDGEPSLVCTKYLQQSNDQINKQRVTRNVIEKSCDFELLKIYMLDELNRVTEKVEYNCSFKVIIEFVLLREIENLTCFISIHTTDFVHVTANQTFDIPKNLRKGNYRVEMLVPEMNILPGVYSIKVWIGMRDGQVLFNSNSLSSFQIYSDDYSVSRFQDLGFVCLNANWKFIENI